jgi:uncharacterized YigZ family protein
LKPYKQPTATAEAEFIEKKSRFIGYISPVESEQAALEFLNSIRVKHREASHNVYAYRLKDGNICRHSDDGEPSGTAGKPLLEVFLKQDIYNFCCVATRYYGGINLGAGGLIRAYARCGVVALEAAGVGIMREVTLCAVTLPYSLYEPTRRYLDNFGAKIISTDFGSEVELKFSLITEELPALQTGFVELTSGSVNIRIEGTRIEASLSEK